VLRPRAHPGATLAELLVAITLGALVLGTASASVLRQQRGARRVAGIVGGAAQTRAGSLLMPAELADLTPSSGDLVGREARDTALQLRWAVAAGVACDSAVGHAVLALADGDELAPGGVAVPPRTGDSLWWYADASSGWRAQRITDVRNVAAAPCPARVSGAEQGSALRLALTDRDTIPAGAVVRVTRPLVYVIYRSGDGSWQLGVRDWSDATQRFAPPQPVAGPFARRTDTGLRTGFRFFGADDSELFGGTGAGEMGPVARIRITTVAVVRSAIAGSDSLHADSADVALRGSGP
jgi:hypothetical protein